MLVSAIIPTYNERQNIEPLVSKIKRIFQVNGINGRIVIVDDSSPDGTGEVVKELAKKMKGIELIERLEKRGIGSAYREAFQRVLSRECDIILEMDADMSHDPEEIPVFLEEIGEGYDLVIGSRYIPGGKICGISHFRKFISRWTNRIVRFLFDLETHDPTSGYRAFSCDGLRKISLSTIKSDGYAFQIEILLHSKLKGLRICEIPITFTSRKSGSSKLNAIGMWNFAKSITRLLFEQPRS